MSDSQSHTLGTDLLPEELGKIMEDTKDNTWPDEEAMKAEELLDPMISNLDFSELKTLDIGQKQSLKGQFKPATMAEAQTEDDKDEGQHCNISHVRAIT